MTGETLEDVNANTNNKLNEDNTVWPEKRVEDVNANTNNKLNEDNTVWPEKR